LPPYDEKNVLDIIEKVSKSVVNISTIKLVHNIFHQAVPVEVQETIDVADIFRPQRMCRS